MLGYHGCDRATCVSVLHDGNPFIPSERDYDWLGPGVYFWENDPLRALEWAEQRVAGCHGDAFVIGAIIDPGNCLDLTLRENMPFLALGFEDLQNAHEKAGVELPENQEAKGGSPLDKPLRRLDCAVIRRVHSLLKKMSAEPFDSVRGLFPEGKPVYPGAQFFDKTHSQIAVRNPDCVVEVFIPRKMVISHGMRLSIEPA